MVGATEAASAGVVVIGAGLGGHRLVVALRTAGYDGPVTLVGDEAALPYDRPPLSKQVLASGATAPALGDAATYAELGVELRLGNAAIGLDCERSRVTLADGSELSYETLVIATGSRARTLRFLDEVGAHTLRTESDALALRRSLAPGARLAVIGGGFVGCEVAASARSLGVDVTVIEALSSLLMRACGPEVGELVRAIHEQHGVIVRCGTSVLSARREGADITLGLSDGTELAVDCVVVGIGGAPDLGWLADTPLAIDDGIVCDPSGRTSVENVYAVGDVARWRHPRLGTGPRCEHWTAAVEQAAVVAHNIATGDARVHDAAPYVWSDQFMTKLQLVGRPAAAERVDVLEWGEQGRPVVLFSRGEHLTGAVGIGAAAAVVRLRRLFARPEVAFAAALDALGVTPDTLLSA